MPGELGRLLKLERFSHYDQALLWAALQAGHAFAVVVDSPVGPKVVRVSRGKPSQTPEASTAQTERVVRLDQIVGLAESASGFQRTKPRGRLGERQVRRV